MLSFQSTLLCGVCASPPLMQLLFQSHLCSFLLKFHHRHEGTFHAGLMCRCAWFCAWGCTWVMYLCSPRSPKSAMVMVDKACQTAGSRSVVQWRWTGETQRLCLPHSTWAPVCAHAHMHTHHIFIWPATRSFFFLLLVT